MRLHSEVIVVRTSKYEFGGVYNSFHNNLTKQIQLVAQLAQILLGRSAMTNTRRLTEGGSDTFWPLLQSTAIQNHFFLKNYFSISFSERALLKIPHPPPFFPLKMSLFYLMFKIYF